MKNYQNVVSLKHLENFIEEGGYRNKKKIYTNQIKPFFSIITVVKNSSASIEKTIKSVLNQNNQNLEYIVIDGNSDDGTLNKIKSYNNKISYWCSINDKGIYDAMNYGLKLANGQVIGILNSGDIYIKNSLNIVKNYFLENQNLSFLFGTVKRHYLGNNVIRIELNIILILKHVIHLVFLLNHIFKKKLVYIIQNMYVLPTMIYFIKFFRIKT